jgi:aspartate kinase
MSFMIDEDDADEALRSLHATFFKDPDPAIFDVEARKPLAEDRLQITDDSKATTAKS